MMPIGDEFQAGQYFGEMSLLGGHRVENDICAVNESTLIALDVETFESVLGPYTKLLEAHYNTAVMAQVPSLRKLTGAELKRLNGVLLQPGPRGEIPSLGQYAKGSRDASVMVRPHTLRFVVFEGVAAKPCFPADGMVEAALAS